MTSMMKRSPVVFIPHGGGPWPFMDFGPAGTWDALHAYLSEIGKTVAPRPRAILMVSAHWEERVFTLQTAEKPPLLYDYSGFPAHTYQLSYPASGAPDVAARVATLLGQAGFEVAANARRGYDHGAFVPLMVMYPQADVPVLQLSLQRDLDPETHLTAGRALQALRDEGVFIVASGNSYHSFAGFKRPEGPAESRTFDAWLTQTVEDPDLAIRCQRLRNWASAPAGRAAHPREEHLIPLMVAVGAAGTDRGHRTFHGEILGFTYSGYQFG